MLVKFDETGLDNPGEGGGGGRRQVGLRLRRVPPRENIAPKFEPIATSRSSITFINVLPISPFLLSTRFFFFPFLVDNAAALNE